MSLVKYSVLLVAFAFFVGQAASQSDIQEKLEEVLGLAQQYECADDVKKCVQGKEIETLKDCNAIKDIARCIYNACPKIKESKDNENFIDLLLEIGKLLGCDFTAKDITGNGVRGQMSVTLGTVFLILSALGITKLFR
ncbi:hypothetical protein PoB_004002100 [Plakobranchus ocellatus]|uniref:Uncharacterized protein n=1 Tax=Plakobranchus ocellatus TaxID=259542 RepID=A0AAV4B3X4_9GAST|nr:hypothetical protein PoB_004002100 [Plakobranchus ocellatus]